MRQFAIKLSLITTLAFGVGVLGFDHQYRTARADAAGGEAVVDAGASSNVPTAPVVIPPPPADGSAAPAPVTKPAETAPADKLHDPIEDPKATFDDVKAVKKLGWGAVALAILIILCRVLGKLSKFGGVLKPLKRLGEGKVAVVVASVGTLAITAYNALILEGSWFAAALAAAISGAALWDAKAKPAPEPAAK